MKPNNNNFKEIILEQFSQFDNTIEAKFREFDDKCVIFEQRISNFEQRCTQNEKRMENTNANPGIVHENSPKLYEQLRMNSSSINPSQKDGKIFPMFSQ